MEQQQALADDQPRGPRELRPVQFFGDDTNGALGVTKGADFRPIISKSEEDDPMGGEITHTFAAEPGEPGVDEDQRPDGTPPVEAPSTGPNDDPAVTGPEPEADDDAAPAAAPEQENKGPKARNSKE